MQRTMFLLLSVVAVTASACGGAHRDESIGHSNDAPAERPIELELATPDGEDLWLSQMRGHWVMVYVFATFDGVSQAELRPIARFVRTNPTVRVLGIAVQPDAKALLDAWKAALDPPFVVAYEREQRIAYGTSPLGALEAVPTFILIDPTGRIRARHVGYASERKLQRMFDDSARAVR